jgi:hypothetical protein
VIWTSSSIRYAARYSSGEAALAKFENNGRKNVATRILIIAINI